MPRLRMPAEYIRHAVSEVREILKLLNSRNWKTWPEAVLLGVPIMRKLLQIEQDILANGKLDGHELEELRDQIYGDGTIDRQKADFLVELHKRVQHMTPAFEQFFYQAVKDHILADGRVGAEESAWLRRLLTQDGKLRDEERKFLHELKGEAKQVSQEFNVLFAECMKQPAEQRTSG